MARYQCALRVFRRTEVTGRLDKSAVDTRKAALRQKDDFRVRERWPIQPQVRLRELLAV